MLACRFPSVRWRPGLIGVADPNHSLVRRTAAALVALTVAAGSLIAGCRRTPAAATSAPLAWPAEERCWWAPFRTVLPPDSVAVRFARAYTTLGLTGATWSHRADTAWAQAGPSALSDSARRGTYAARVVAFRRGDTTLFRPFVATPPDALNPARDQIAFCGETMRVSRPLAIAPRVEEPDHALPLWRRRP